MTVVKFPTDNAKDTRKLTTKVLHLYKNQLYDIIDRHYRDFSNQELSFLNDLRVITHDLIVLREMVND